MSERDPIDFASLAAALLDRSETLVSQWLDDGHREGHEWKARNPIRDDRHIGSFSVNLVSGNWADFADDDAKGGDLISLYAYLNRLNNGQAARQLMRTLGWASRDDDDVQTPARNRPAPKVASEESASPQRKKKQSKWRALVPVPPHAPRPSFVFGYRDEKRGDWIELDAVKTWAYQFEGQLFGYVARFERTTSDGEISKETIPRTWCVDESDDRGLQRWHWKTWEAPRPLYVPATLLSGTPADVPVVLVEGEKCAMSGHELLGHEFDFVSWPGGGKAWAKASWNWLMGRTVFMWPDCDAKRVLLTRVEREAGVDPSTKPLLPEAKQPGVKAMISIGSLLVAEYGCTVYLCQIPKPGAVSDGWDIADAIAQGWDADQVRGFIRRAHVFTPPDDAARARARATEGISTPSLAGADQEEPDRNWRSALLTSAQGATKAVRENIVVALDGLPEKGITGIPEALGVVGFNEFTNDVVLLKQAPWGSPDGPCAEVEDMLMGEWLVREHWLPSMPRGTLEEGLRIVAHRHRFHPVRQRLMGLKWDGTPRLGTWLRRACLEEDEWNDEDDLQRYLRLAGTFFLMGMVARVLEPVKVGGGVIRGPGTKFDYMLILEGRTGLRKSTLLQTLAGEHFADTGLVLGDKDSYQQLQGVWLYEIPELDAFSKATS
jgi:putative DNA primase/helicase